jgi:putative addiction module component (TIGR02574 family)
MVQPINPADFSSLSIDERIALVQAIWDSIAAETDRLPLTDPQKQELDRRIAELDANPENVLTWEAIKSRVQGQR